jgi:hypothetical protein
MQIRSVSFDTSFLLKDDPLVDLVIKKLKTDKIPCFLTSTVTSELEQLKIWDRISSKKHRIAIKRLKTTNTKVIDFKNRLLSDAFGKTCMSSMKKHLGVKVEDIANDCNILVSNLKGGIDVFLSEDYHFTSKITRKVINEVKNAACYEYHQMCGSKLYAFDTDTFLKIYYKGKININNI